MVFEVCKGSQLVVLVVVLMVFEVIEQYVICVVEVWKFGCKWIDDGVILVVVKDDCVVCIEVGYGLEGVFIDFISRCIIDEVILLCFWVQDYYGGISVGLVCMVGVIDGEFLFELVWVFECDGGGLW